MATAFDDGVAIDLTGLSADRSPIPACVFSNTMRIVEANPALCRLLGQRRDALVGLDARELQRLFFADPLAAIERLYLGHDAGREVIEARLEVGGDEPTWVHLRFHSQRNRTGVIERTAVYFLDVTELRSTQVRLTRRLELEDLLRSMAFELLEVQTADESTALEIALGRLGQFFKVPLTYLVDVAADGSPGYAGFWSLNPHRFGRGHLEETSTRVPLLPDVGLLFPQGETTSAVWTTGDTDAPLPRRFAEFMRSEVASCIGTPLVVGGNVVGMLVCTAPGERSWTRDEVDAMHGTVAMLAQFRSRVSAEREVKRRLELEDSLRSIALRFLDASQAEGASTVAASLATFGAAIRAERVMLWSINHTDMLATLAADWVHERIDEAPPTNPEIDLGQLENLNMMFEWTEARRSQPSDLADLLGFTPPWCVGNEILAAPIRSGQRTSAIVLCLDSSDHGWDESEISALQSFANLVPAMNARLEAETQLTSAFDSAPVGITLRDEMGMLLACNESYLSFLGRATEDELLGSLQMEVLDIASCDMEELEWAVRLEETNGVELPYLRSDNTTVWGRTSNVLIQQGEKTLMLGHVEDITEARSQREALEYQANHDELTGLSNRRRLIQELNELLDQGRSPEAAGVMLIDLDRFKIVNDSLGHSKGDSLLRSVADRFRLAIRPRDTVARFGGDEFVILLRGPVGPSDAAAVATRLLDLLSEPFTLGGQTVFSGASIGIAFPDPSDAHNEDVLRHADAAMYEAKRKGRNRYEVFDQAHRELVMLRSQTEADLRRAVGDQSLIVHYQPEFDLATRSIIGAEALVRWPHVERGLLTAADFVSIAEDTGLATELGTFVLREACRAAGAWRRQFNLDVFQIRVNVSTKQLDKPDFVAIVSRALLDTGLPADALCLEITETALMNDPDLSLRTLAEVEALGVSLAVDDFGTGFSSLAYLKRFPVNTLKVDREFVTALSTDTDDQAIVATILALAESLGLDLVAEGIETEEQLAMLRNMGVTRGQGYLLSKPVPFEFLAAQIELAEFLG